MSFLIWSVQIKHVKSISVTIVTVWEKSVVYIKELQTSLECAQVFCFSSGKWIQDYSWVT